MNELTKKEMELILNAFVWKFNLNAGIYAVSALDDKINLLEIKSKENIEVLVVLNKKLFADMVDDYLEFLQFIKGSRLDPKNRKLKKERKGLDIKNIPNPGEFLN